MTGTGTRRSAGGAALPGVHRMLGEAGELQGRLGHPRLGLRHVLAVALERHGDMVADLAPLPVDAADVHRALAEAGGGPPLDVDRLLSAAASRAARRGSARTAERDLIAALMDELLAGPPEPAGEVRLRGPVGVRSPPRRELEALAALEAADAVAADRGYAMLEDANQDASPLRFVVALLAPVVAMVLAFYVAPALPFDRTWTSVVIVLLIGYLPPGLLFAGRVITSGFFDGVSGRKRMVSALGFAAMMMFEGILFAMAVVVAFLVVALPVFVVVASVSWILAGTPWTEPLPEVSTPLFTVLFVATLVFTLSDTHPRILADPRRAPGEIGAGLRARAGDITQLLSGLTIGVVLAGAGPLELLYDKLWLAVVAAAMSGVLLAFTIYRIEADGRQGVLLGLGRVRCDVRRGRLGSARYRLGRLDDNPQRVKTETGEHLIGCLSAVLRVPDQPHVVERLGAKLAEAERSAARSERPEDWTAAVAATGGLIEDVAAGRLAALRLGAP